MPAPDPLYSAEEQMIKHEVEAFSAFFRKVSSRLPRDLTDPDPQPLTDAEVTAAVERTLGEDPEARELAERLAVFQRFRTSPAEGGE